MPSQNAPLPGQGLATQATKGDTTYRRPRLHPNRHRNDIIETRGYCDHFGNNWQLNLAIINSKM